MNPFDCHSSRTKYYQSIIDALAKRAFSVIDENGKILLPPEHGSLWVGTLIYVIGELKRVQNVDITNYQNKNLFVLANTLLRKWESRSEIDACFVGLGLIAWGELNAWHPIYKQLSKEEQINLRTQLQVTREFSNNWEAFNSCIEGANKILQPQKKNTIEIHEQKILDKYSETGYHDDLDGFGVYDSYGIMSLNYCIKALEALTPHDPSRKKLLPLFEENCLRYFQLIKAIIYPDGSGWPFGRSVGVLGQLQCIIFLEQCLFHEFIKAEDAQWARGAIRALVNRMVDLFWDSEMQWFSFRDEYHTCYEYRNSLPMHYDLLRYFLQMYEYARLDESKTDNKELPYSSAKKFEEIIVNPKKKMSIFVWSDSVTQFVLPIMNSSLTKKHFISDYLAKPHSRGIIEGVTERLKPIWVPCLTINNTEYYPAIHFEKSELIRESNQDIYRVYWGCLYANPKAESALDSIHVITDYIFSNNRFERCDRFSFYKEHVIEKYQMIILQACSHPKRKEGYGVVQQITPSLNCQNLSLHLSEKIEIKEDLSYRNYFGRPSHQWIISGENLKVLPGQQATISTSIIW